MNIILKEYKNTAQSCVLNSARPVVDLFVE